MTEAERPVRMAVIGTGYIGQYHAEKLCSMEGAQLVGVVDVDPERAAAVAARYRTTPFTDHRDLFGQVDAVSIASPTPSHFAIARDFLLRDVDVLIEKPMTTTLTEADELIELAESRGLLIQVGQLERFNSVVQPLRRMVDRPLFIESHRIHVFKNRCTDVSVVLDLMIHDIDLILTLVGSEVTEVHAAGAAVVSNHVDIANARLEFASGCVANVTSSRISMKNERKLRLFQKEVYISVDMGNREVTIVRPRGGVVDPAGVPSMSIPCPIPGMDIRRSVLEPGDALADELRSFTRSVARREVPEVTGQMGRAALRVALAVMDQIRATQRRILGQ